MRLTQDLKSVTDANDQPTAGGKLLHRLHDGGKPRDRSRTQIVAIGKTARHDDRVAILQVSRLMPQHRSRLSRRVVYRVIAVMVAIGSGKHDHAEFHKKSLSATL